MWRNNFTRKFPLPWTPLPWYMQRSFIGWSDVLFRKLFLPNTTRICYALWKHVEKESSQEKWLWVLQILQTVLEKTEVRKRATFVSHFLVWGAENNYSKICDLLRRAVLWKKSLLFFALHLRPMIGEFLSAKHHKHIVSCAGRAGDYVQ